MIHKPRSPMDYATQSSGTTQRRVIRRRKRDAAHINPPCSNPKPKNTNNGRGGTLKGYPPLPWRTVCATKNPHIIEDCYSLYHANSNNQNIRWLEYRDGKYVGFHSGLGRVRAIAGAGLGCAGLWGSVVADETRIFWCSGINQWNVGDFLLFSTSKFKSK